MKVVIMEIGQFFDVPSTRQAFDSIDTAKSYIPDGFIEIESTFDWQSYENKKTEQYLNINRLEIETGRFNQEIQQTDYCRFHKCQHAHYCNQECDFIKYGC